MVNGREFERVFRGRRDRVCHAFFAMELRMARVAGVEVDSSFDLR
jgi:hypothetical protein